jgi:hypothetical protein
MRSSGNIDAPPHVQVSCPNNSQSVFSSPRPRFTRNAEMNAWVKSRGWTDMFYFLGYIRYSTHWSFATQWCTYLTQAPATAELLAMLRGLIENSLFVQKNEINHALLKEWLNMMPMVSA